MFFIIIVKNLILITALLLFFSCSSTPKTNYKKKANAYYTQGTTDLLEKKYTKALTNLIEANKIHPKDSDTLNNLGMAYYFKNRTKLAKKYLHSSLKINPDNSDARNNLASIFYREKRYDAAENQYQKIREHLTYPYQFRVLYNMALISKKKNQIDKAIQRLKLSVKENNDYCPAHIQLGMIYSENSNFKEALIHFSNATKGPCYKYPIPSYMKALTLFNLKKTFRAKAIFRDIMARFPNTKYAKLSKKQLIKINEVSYSHFDSPYDLKKDREKKSDKHNFSRKKARLFSTPQF